MRLAVLIAPALLLVGTGPQSNAVHPRDLERQVMEAIRRSAGPALERALVAKARSKDDPVAHLGVGLLRLYALDRQVAEEWFGRVNQLPRASAAEKSWASYYRASSMAARGRLAEADTLFQRELVDARARGDRRLEARLTTGLAAVRLVLATSAASDALLARADSVLTPADTLERALVLCTRAAVAFRTGRGEGAQQALAGWELARAAGDFRTSASCRQRKAMILERRGFLDNALDDLRRGIEDARVVNAFDIIANAGQFRGYVLSRWGAFGEATEAYTEAIAAARKARDTRAESWSLLGLAWVSAFAREFDRAVELRDQAVAVFTPIPDRAGLANAIELRAMIARLSGDLAGADRYYQEARDTYQAMGFRTQLHGIYRELAVIAQERSEWTAAQRWLEEASRIASETRVLNWAKDRLYHDAVSALGQRQNARADSLLDVYLTGAADSVYMTAQAWFRKAEARLRARDVAGAEEALTRGDRSLDLWRNRLSLKSLRLAAFQMEQSMGSTSDRLPALLAQLARVGKFDVAFNIAERRRGRELHDRLLRNEAVLGIETDSTRSRARVASANLDPDALLQALGDSTALLHFVAGDGRESSAVLVVARDVRRVVPIPPLDSLAPDIERFMSLVSSGAEASAVARRVAVGVVDGALQLLPQSIRRLVIVPDGLIHRVPFDLLRLASGEMLVQRYAVVLTPSARIALTSGRSTSPARSILALGDPSFGSLAVVRGERQAADPARARVGSTTTLARLPLSADEARRVGRFGIGSSVRLRRDASEAALKRMARQPLAVLHLATHAIVDDRALGQSVVALAPGGGDDGILNSAEISALRLEVDLVVLSACRTAGGVVFSGEGVQGLTVPFFEAGARSVLATQWDIRDASPGPFVERVYANLARGHTVADAVWLTKLDAIRAGVPVDQWAAFVITGDGLQRLDLRRSTQPPRDWPRRPA